MSRRQKGTYSILDNPVLEYAKRHRDASVSVLVALAEQSNYTRQPFLRVAEIMLETDLKERAVEKCLARLLTAELCARTADGWVYQQANVQASEQVNGEANSGANDEANHEANGSANDGANGEAYSGTPYGSENPVQDGVSQPLKEVEGIRRKEEIKEPPSPQGGEPEAGDSNPDQVQTQEPDASQSQATDNGNVPRRRTPAPPMPGLPEDLAALPGVQVAWDRWLGYRAEAKIKNTPQVLEAQFRKLRALHDAGDHLPDVIEQAIGHSWRSFFPLKQTRQADRPSPTDTPERTREEWLQ